MKHLFIYPIAVILTTTLSTPLSSATSAGLSTYETILQNRDQIALELTGPIHSCVVRNDTKHPAFHGCLDWHSAVHATWALLAYTNMTADRRYVPTIRSILSKESLDKERQELRDDIDFEMPYGRAWFLRLVVEYGRLFDDGLLTDFGDEVATSLINHYRQHPPEPDSRNYNNAAWAFINLLEYGHYRGRKDIEAFVRVQTETHYLNGPGYCRSDDYRSDFMAVCTNWAWLVGSFITGEPYVKWASGFLPDPESIAPITEPTSNRSNGQNFSRCWGLYRLYKFTGEKKYLDAFTEHFLASYFRREHWDGNYRKVSHWVAQFGMFALMPVFSDSIDQ